MTTIESLRLIPTADKVRYIIDILFMGNYDEFWEAYQGECRHSLRTNDWDWLDEELEAYIYQEQITLEDVQNYSASA